MLSCVLVSHQFALTWFTKAGKVMNFSFCMMVMGPVLCSKH